MLLIYGATGYTGRLISHTARSFGVTPVLAARSRIGVSALAGELGYQYRAFDLDHIDLTGVSVVLNCAGPFIHTAMRMADACIRAGVHYVDITGEIEVFEQLHACDAAARAAGVMLLPGAGFDVVPSDCLAAHLKRRLPTATRLTLGISGTGILSRGTASTMIEHADRGGMIRRDGVLTRVRPGWRTRDVDFGAGPRQAVTIPWGDVATSWYSTGIPNVEVYSVLPPGTKPLLTLTRYFGWLMRKSAVKKMLLKKIRSGPPGPSEEQLERGFSFVWGEVVDDEGRFAEARLQGPNGYKLTALTALMIAKRILSGQATPGFQTPSLAYGADFIMEVPGSLRTDL